MKTSKFRKSILGGVAAAALAFSALTFLTPATAFAKEHGVVNGNYFLSDYDTRAEVVEAGSKIYREIAAEGTVLLKNEMPDGSPALPLTNEKTVSLFGKNLYAKMGISLARAGFRVNPALNSFYGNASLTGSGAPGGGSSGTVLNGLRTGEADISLFNDTDDSIREYNDFAIVGIYRAGGEGVDLPRTMAQVDGDNKKFGANVQPVDGARAADDHYLQLDANEAALLKYCGERFEKVIVIIDTPAPMELGFLDDPDHYAYSENIVAALWTNASGANFTSALVDILKGDVSPSGRLPDTYARDFKADPTWNNFGNNFSEYGADGVLKGNQYANLEYSDGTTNGGGGYFSNYVYFKEGIYVGYRYFETRGFVEGDKEWTGEETDTLSRYAHGPNEAIHYYSKLSADKPKQEALDGKTWNNWYDAHVVYPFGYGLSYTNFDWKLKNITPTLDGGGKISAQVEVTNAGRFAGKDVVQLYYSAPYTDGGIEKAHVALGAFAKTGVLRPGEKETVTLELAVRDMASYDYNDANGNGFKGYELDAGTYDIYIGKNAHCWADAGVISKSYALEENVQYGTDEVTGNDVENRFDRMSEQLTRENRYPEDGANPEKDKYMSRADFAGTYPTLSFRLEAEQWIIDGLKLYNDIHEFPYDRIYPEDKPSDPWYTDVMPVTGAVYDTPVKLDELFGLDYDDPLWDKFLNQLSVAQIKDLALKGPYSSGIDAPELGITTVVNQDRPERIQIPGAATNVSLPGDILTAATWNTELAYRRGNILANISLWGNGSDLNSRVPGWYAPAVNIHRNPFGGRVGEYLSEDGVLTGKIAARIVQGAQDKGMFCYVKHFALNGQETNRCGLITWANEQAMREVFFTPFELTVKEGKTLGMMSSLNRFGPRWAGGCYELLTEVLRDEWGFRGCVVTDMMGAWANADCMIRAGGSLMLGYGRLYVDSDCKTATTVNCLRNGAHDVLYTHANSMALNRGETPTAPKRMIEFSPKLLDIAMVGTEYSQSLADCITLNTDYYADADISEVTFTPDGSLPRGLTLSEDGIISGTPEKEARVTFTVVATYGKEVLKRDFTITVAGENGALVYNTVQAEFNGLVGEAFNATVAKAEIFAPNATPEEIAAFPEITYSLANGSLLPEGLTLDKNGRITGNPAKECRDYAFTVVASAEGYDDADCTFTVSLLYNIVYTPVGLEDGRYGKSYIAYINTANCELPVTYSLKGEDRLPKGLTLTASGIITGTPSEAGTKTFTVVASNPYANDVEVTYTLTVNLAFDSMTRLPYGKAGEEYYATAGTAQGSFDVEYEIAGGALPGGLKLGKGGEITGTPEVSGNYSFTVRATSGNASDEITLNIFVDNADALTATVGAGENGGLAIASMVIAGVAIVGCTVLTVLFAVSGKPKNDDEE